MNRPKPLTSTHPPAADRKKIFFHGGKGYTDKDWGTRFPTTWIWLQSNHFQVPVFEAKSVPVLPIGHHPGAIPLPAQPSRYLQQPSHYHLFMQRGGWKVGDGY